MKASDIQIDSEVVDGVRRIVEFFNLDFGILIRLRPDRVVHSAPEMRRSRPALQAAGQPERP